MEISDRSIALLIDSDNISKQYFSILMDELYKFGNVTYKRIYGDFTKGNANGWGDILLEFAIEPMQQYAFTKGKNSTDSAMIIDAMDILYRGKVDCVCLATSDSDFTKLATRFRNENYMVIGAGEQKTPLSFRAACNRFILMDVLLAESKKENIIKDNSAEVESPIAVNKSTAKEKTNTNKSQTIEKEEIVIDSALTPKRQLIYIVTKIIDDEGDADGSMLFAVFMSSLYKKDNAFNPKNYGESRKLIPFFKKLEIDGKKPFTIELTKSAERIKINK